MSSKYLSSFLLLESLQGLSFEQLELGRHYKGIVVFKNGKREEGRFFRQKSNPNYLFVFLPHHSTKGYEYNKKEIDFLLVDIPKSQKEETPAGKYIRILLKTRNYILKNRHPNVLPSLEKEFTSFTEKDLELFKAQNFEDDYECWKRAPEFNLPQIGGYKTTSLRTWGFKEETILNIKKHMDKKESFNYFIRTRYDCHAEGEIYNNEFRCYLSLEYKGIGNGHYYYLINFNHALWYADD